MLPRCRLLIKITITHYKIAIFRIIYISEKTKRIVVEVWQIWKYEPKKAGSGLIRTI